MIEQILSLLLIHEDKSFNPLFVYASDGEFPVLDVMLVTPWLLFETSYTTIATTLFHLGRFGWVLGNAPAPVTSVVDMLASA